MGFNFLRLISMGILWDFMGCLSADSLLTSPFDDFHVICLPDYVYLRVYHQTNMGDKSNHSMGRS